LLTTYDETEGREIQEIYPSNVHIKYVKPANNFLVNALRYLVKDAGDVDILHFHDFPFFRRDFGLAMKAHLKRRKLVYTHHIGLEEVVRNELELGEIGELMLGYYYLALNRFGKIWKKVVVPSQYIVNHDLARFGALKDRICVIGNGVDVDRIRKVKPIKLEGYPSILFVGHLLWRKGIDLLLEAFHKFSLQPAKANPKLYIIGSGPLEKRSREYVDKQGLGGNVHFCDCTSESLKFGMIKGADIVAVPSRYENAPITLLEAMAAGRPVVATRVGGIP
jgi:glycosyltransferase involved in cell wall biosynthesis